MGRRGGGGDRGPGIDGAGQTGSNFSATPPEPARHRVTYLEQRRQSIVFLVLIETLDCFICVLIFSFVFCHADLDGTASHFTLCVRMNHFQRIRPLGSGWMAEILRVSRLERVQSKAGLGKPLDWWGRSGF